ncbi:MAG TPA: glycosyltransferase [Polyangiaceae bacterium]|nr:glycosyltransferase [Polyangiaceae bacterium]
MVRLPMLKVLHVITGLNQGGAERALMRLMLHEDKSRFSSEAFSLIGDGLVARQMREQGLRTLNCGPRRGGLSATLMSLIAHCLRSRPDVVQGWMYHGNLAATLAATAACVPLHGWNVRCSPSERLEEKLGTRLAVSLGARLSHLPTWIIHNSYRGEAQHRARGYSPTRATVIPNGFDCEALRPDDALRTSLRNRHDVSAQALVVGMMARHHAQKDYPGFIRAAARIAAQFPTVCFIAMGRGVDWSNDALRMQIEELGLRHRFRLLGDVPDGGRCATMFDVNVLSSAFGEGFPNAIAEGMACGVPCVATDVGDTAWIIGDTGRVVPSSNPVALGSAVSDLLGRTREEREKLGALARARVLREFSMTKNVSNYAALFDAGYSSRGRTVEMADTISNSPQQPATQTGSRG